jgi:hypothetical protein
VLKKSGTEMQIMHRRPFQNPVLTESMKKHTQHVDARGTKKKERLKGAVSQDGE